mmetsp:Transcript_3791/g.10473  ORF Transcript_3791/g.10473 Transcript_3791/m.10473 type:complete len:227 (-) Transcript_3791:885-1565(-)
MALKLEARAWAAAVVCCLAAILVAAAGGEADVPEGQDLTASAAATPSGSFLIGERRFSPTEAVEMGNVTITYIIHNVGDLPAFDVDLSDALLLDVAFDVPGGAEGMSFEEIPAGGKVEHAISVTVKGSGVFGDSSESAVYKPTAAKIEYASERTSETKRVQFLASVNRLFVEDAVSYRKRTDKHLIDWAGFLAVSLLLTAMPYFVAESTRTKIARSVASRSSKKGD